MFRNLKKHYVNDSFKKSNVICKLRTENASPCTNEYLTIVYLT